MERLVMTINVDQVEEAIRVYKHGENDFSVTFAQGGYHVRGTAAETWEIISSAVENAKILFTTPEVEA